VDLSEFANLYQRQQRLRRSYAYAANRFVKACGPVNVEDLTTDLLEQYRSWCVAKNLRPATIEGSIRELIALHFAATGVRLNPGSKLRVPRPQPHPPSLDAISAVYSESPAWVRQYLAVGYWTCLRVADVLRLQASLSGPRDVLRWTASKTGHSQAWPVPAWLQRHLVLSVVIPPGKPNHHLKRVLRRELRAAADRAGVDYFTAHQLRQRALTEWSRVNAMAGGIVHGSGLGVLGHYVDPLSVLESAAPTVRLPAAFASDEEREVDALPALLLRLDPDARRILTETAQRLAN